MVSGDNGRGILLALMAGSMAAMASMSAKLAMTAEVVNRLCQGVMGSNSEDTDGSSFLLCDSLSTLLRVLCFGGIFVFNALMWTLYTKSLQFCSSTVEATVTNTAANFLVTALVGFFLFKEQLSILWWCGSCLILAGLILIHQASTETETDTDSKRE